MTEKLDIEAVSLAAREAGKKLLADDQLLFVAVFDTAKTSWGTENMDPYIVPSVLRELADKIEAAQRKHKRPVT